ncbi:MAG TPA: VirB8/TrbF family protein [Candidatus Angelobacter sp.]|nr:VirB8/TrbF family protein [Candidatus Angelobacter sp.]
MWLKKADRSDKRPAPEKLEYSRYYEHDGALRAYANRAMVLALISLPTAFLAVALAAYVRLQPPTVIRIDSTGSASVVKDKREGARPQLSSQGSNAEPNEFERNAYVKSFLEHYLSFSPESVRRNWADGLNMMTANLRQATLLSIDKNNLVGKIQDEQITSVFHLRSLEPAQDDPLSFIAYGVKDVHRVRDHQETTDKLVGEFRIRLITERRSETNPSGLLIAEYGERLIEGERKDAMARDTSLGNSPN